MIFHSDVNKRIFTRKVFQPRLESESFFELGNGLERFSYDLELKTRYIHLRNNWAQGCSSGDPMPARREEQKVWPLARGRRASLARFFATLPFRKPLLYHHTQ